jgi:hypothetical protein
MFREYRGSSAAIRMLDDAIVGEDLWQKSRAMIAGGLYFDCFTIPDS